MNINLIIIITFFNIFIIINYFLINIYNHLNNFFNLFIIKSFKDNLN
jgi:hypothetical protein